MTAVKANEAPPIIMRVYSGETKVGELHFHPSTLTLKEETAIHIVKSLGKSLGKRKGSTVILLVLNRFLKRDMEFGSFVIPTPQGEQRFRFATAATEELLGNIKIKKKAV